MEKNVNNYNHQTRKQLQVQLKTKSNLTATSK